MTGAADDSFGERCASLRLACPGVEVADATFAAYLAERDLADDPAAPLEDHGPSWRHRPVS